MLIAVRIRRDLKKEIEAEITGEERAAQLARGGYVRVIVCVCVCV